MGKWVGVNLGHGVGREGGSGRWEVLMGEGGMRSYIVDWTVGMVKRRRKEKKRTGNRFSERGSENGLAYDRFGKNG